MVFKICDDGMYGQPERYAGVETISVPMIGDLVVDMKSVFAE